VASYCWPCSPGCEVAVTLVRRKYGNKPCEINGEKYRSQRERDRHQELVLLQRAGQIAGLTREVPFVLADAVTIQGRRRPSLRYVADYVYCTADGQQVVEDCKGVRTPVYNLKRHLMMSVHGIEIKET
jgi:hypothetical protein